MIRILQLIICLLASSFLMAQSQRTMLIEEFTQASCPPCEVTTPPLNDLLSRNLDRIVQIRYQTSWPGVDPMNADNPGEVQDRVDYYGVSGVPNLLMDGSETVGDQDALLLVSQDEIDTRSVAEAPILVDVTHSISADLASADVTVTITNEGADEFAAGSALRVALVEEEISWPSPPGSTSITVFEAVLKTFFTGTDGMELPAIAAGETWTNTWTGVEIATAVYDYKQLGVVAFVQDDGSREVFNAAHSSPVELTGTYDDLAIFRPSRISSNLCEYEYSPSVSVANLGDNEVSDFTVSVLLNNAPLETITVEDAVSGGGLANIDFTPITLPEGTTVISYEVEAAGVDPALLDNISSPQISRKIAEEATGELNLDFEQETTGDVPEGVIADVPTDIVVFNEPDEKLGAYGLSGAAMRVNFWNWDVSVLPREGSAVFTSKVDVDTEFSTLSFDYAFTTWGGSNDGMTIQVSTDCGSTYTDLWSDSGSSFATADEINENMAFFIPSANDWDFVEVDLKDYIGQEILVRFLFLSDFGDMLWLDNINILGVSDLNELSYNESLEV